MSIPPRPEDQPDAGSHGEVPTCYRHPERESYIRCQRCGRSICPDCQRQAAVGFQCVECVRAGARTMPTARTRFGGVVRGGGAVVTKFLVGINVAVYLLTLLVGPVFVQSLQLVGRAAFLDSMGGIQDGVAGGGYWRLLTSAFLHVQLWHLLVNMFSLWVMGPAIEHLLGRLRFVGLYLGSALAGSAVAYAFTSPDVPVVGASGAIFGLFGATAVLARRMRADMSWLLGILAVNVLLNVLFRDVLSWQGHLGGFLAGLVLGAVIAYAPRERRDLAQGLGFVAVLAAVAALVFWRTADLGAAVVG